MKRAKKVLVHFRITKELREDLENLSKYYGQNQTYILEESLRHHFTEHHGKELLSKLRLKREQGIEL